MKPKRITAPAGEPVTLQEVKDHLRVFFSDQDDLITGYIKAAVARLDGYRGILNRCLMSQQWQVSAPRFSSRLETLFTDTTAALIEYYDEDDQKQTVDTSNYRVYPDSIVFKRDFTPPVINRDRDDPILITTTHGYDQVPEDIKLAIKIMVAHWYRNREAVAFGVSPAQIPLGVNDLIAPHRWAF